MGDWVAWPRYVSGTMVVLACGHRRNATLPPPGLCHRCYRCHKVVVIEEVQSPVFVRLSRGRAW